MSPASRVTSMKPPSPPFRKSDGRIGIRDPGPARDEDVHAAVIVVVGLITHQPAELAVNAGLPRAVLEGPVPLVAVVRHGLHSESKRGHDEVEQAVVVKVLHDRPAGRVEAVETDKLADFAKSADVELRVEETSPG